MLYKNVKTGVQIDVKSELGGAWEPVEAPMAAKAPAPKKETKGAKKK